jgi:lysophospholipase L1-like esterase
VGKRIPEALGASLLVVLSVAVSLAPAEVTFRLLGHRGEPITRISNIYLVDDPILDWRYVPNSEIRSGRVVYRYNGAGFRDTHHDVRKPAGIERIVVLGDSVTEGYEVEWADVFAQVLQSRLGDRYEVINIAAGGLNTPQEIHLFERVGSKYGPDLVVVNFVLNDVDFYTKFAPAQHAAEQADSRIAMLNLPIHPGLKRLLKSSALIYFVKDRLESLRARLVGTGATDDYYDRIWASEANRQKVTDGFSKLAALQREGHFEVLVIIWPLMTDYQTYRFGWVHQWVGREAAKVGFAVIDLLPPLSSVPYRKLQVSAEDSVHPNALGHRLAAEAFLAWYRSSGRAEHSGRKS